MEGGAPLGVLGGRPRRVSARGGARASGASRFWWQRWARRWRAARRRTSTCSIRRRPRARRPCAKRTQAPRRATARVRRLRPSSLRSSNRRVRATPAATASRAMPARRPRSCSAIRAAAFAPSRVTRTRRAAPPTARRIGAASPIWACAWSASRAPIALASERRATPPAAAASSASTRRRALARPRCATPPRGAA